MIYFTLINQQKFVAIWYSFDMYEMAKNGGQQL